MSDSKLELDVTPRPTHHPEAVLQLDDHIAGTTVATPFVKWAGGKRSVIK